MILPDLSPEQSAALDQIEAFLDRSSPPRPWFTVMGLAGVGKIGRPCSRVAQRYPRALPVCFTGKAASVLGQKMGRKVSTVHSAIYRFEGEDEDKELIFSKVVNSDGWKGKIILLDELSTIGVKMGNDLVNTGARIVATGDPGQLPPVKDFPFFTGPPDVILREVHRQALESPIIRQAHAVRRGGDRYRADTEDFRGVRSVSHDDIVAADAVLCWKNPTRLKLNTLIQTPGAARRPTARR